MEQHAAALQPRTPLGWLAMGSFLAFSSAAGSAALCLASATIATLAYAFIGIVAVTGATAGFWLFVLSGILFLSSIGIAWLATCAAAGYIFLASTAATFSFLHSRLLPGSASPEAIGHTSSLPPLSTEAHSATSSAPQLSGDATATTTAAPDVSPGRLQNPMEAPPAAHDTITLADVISNIANGPPPNKAAAAVHPNKSWAQNPSFVET